MSIKQGILAELKHVKDNTLKVLNNLDNTKFDYRPHQKSMSLGELANHIVELHNWVEIAITKDVFDFHTDYTPSKLPTKEELIILLESGFLKNKEVVENFDETKYVTDWTLKAGDHIIAQMPKAAALRYIVTNHLIHHRGQLTVYMRLLDIPVPGVYGPSADDK